MENINFVKNIDNLGRIVIPMDVRRKLNINTGDVLSIVVNDNNIVLSRYSSLDSPRLYNILSLFSELVGIKYILANKDKVIYSNVVPNNSKFDLVFKKMVYNGINIKNTKYDFVIGNNKISGMYNMLPIVTKDGIVGSLVVFGSDADYGFKYCELLSKIIMLELNIT